MPEARGGCAQTPARRRAPAQFFALVWLAYLAYPVASLWQPHLSLLLRTTGAVGLALFVATYVWGWAGLGWVAAGAAWATPLAFTLAAGLSAVLGPAFTGLFIFAASLGSRLRSPILAGVAAVVDTAACALSLHLLHAGVSLGASLTGTCALTALVTLGMRRLAVTSGDLSAAREEIARLAAVDERLRIARDVHDLLGHSLAVIALKAELARRLVPGDPQRATAEIADVEAVARRSLAEVREAVAGYRRPRLDDELARAREGLEAAGIRCAYTRSAGALAPEMEAVLAWVVREAATNVLRHSGARTCQIQVGHRADRVQALVEDDGTGPPASGWVPGNGLAGLEERVRSAGGELCTGRASLGGFRLEAWVPAL